MGARSEVESYITSNWQDKKVARWVIGSLPLLEKEFAHPSCPVFNLSFNDGLVQKPETGYGKGFRNTPKIVMSGGFEGTRGHMWAVSEMREVRALTADVNTPFVLMLEPDSYIKRQKGRNPIVNLNQREQLWSTSGLVDAVILLPEKEDRVSNEEHYDVKIHNRIAPAVWCANVQNPYWFRIITRMMQKTEPVHIIRLFKHRPEIRTSFLDSTKNLSAREVKKALYPYILEMVKDTQSYQVPHFLTPEQTADIIFKRVVKGL